MSKDAKKAKKKTVKSRETRSRPKGAVTHRYTRKTADKHELYQLSVQDPQFELEFIDKAFKRATGRRAQSVREDFCGTALFCGAWVESRAGRTAIGIDLDQSVMDWGVEHTLKSLNEPGRRIQLMNQDVREPVKQRSDENCELLSSKILTIMVKGTLSSIPIGPQSQPQKTKLKKTTKAESPSLRPISLGSSTLPTTVLTVRKPIPTAMVLGNPN